MTISADSWSAFKPSFQERPFCVGGHANGGYPNFSVTSALTSSDVLTKMKAGEAVVDAQPAS